MSLFVYDRTLHAGRRLTFGRVNIRLSIYRVPSTWKRLRPYDKSVCLRVTCKQHKLVLQIKRTQMSTTNATREISRPFKLYFRIVPNVTVYVFEKEWPKHAFDITVVGRTSVRKYGENENFETHSRSR